MTLSTNPLERQAAILQEGARRGASYLTTLSDRPVRASTDGLGAFDFALPKRGISVFDVLDLIDRVGAPGTVASAASRYFGYVIGGSLPAASGTRAMLTAWDQVADAPTGPSVVAMDEVAIRWMVDLLKLPSKTEGVFTTGATMANVALLATARDELLDRQGHRRGKSLIGHHQYAS
jgi:glutamate/tyrosine decarboxylase-like PLP-dependent enzyme